MNKTAALSNLSRCIVQSLLLLLQDKALDEISVKEIVEKAGVNRSTYYRHFSTKQDVVRHFYQLRLDEYLSSVSTNISARAYFTGMFESFLRYKKELILLDQRGPYCPGTRKQQSRRTLPGLQLSHRRCFQQLPILAVRRHGHPAG